LNFLCVSVPLWLDSCQGKVHHRDTETQRRQRTPNRDIAEELTGSIRRLVLYSVAIPA